MKIAEIYKSVQGEGLLTGTPSVFVRASGCNLRCWFCDTPFASWQPEGTDYAVDEIVAEIEEWDCRHVVLTGGEPMLFAELIPLTEALRASGRYITVETAGTLFLPIECDLMSISPKFSASGPDPARFPHWHRRHARQRFQPEVIAQFLARYEYQLKFVIDRASEIDEVDQFLGKFLNIQSDRVLLMPQGTTQEELAVRSEWLEPICQERGWTFCPRKQIEWFGPVRGT
ncbi:7-carboxy-7-deazaguanine synthase QueE [Bythopirellula polymerisocia]|uniref:7-carboxy-7-deazaguanine synthase n=1 Tax=Bythopirellula polymerisocia TaxID=2528003 RepID=A0A5C6CPH5_9BACT|nr:7-carboxy-7-deazaguanine synthase QueE [Bythopirellula polymerisocia]TWU24649.1 7-carboxy-7-deazaguanine synthase [Bythopirellula polymerisocia]